MTNLTDMIDEVQVLADDPTGKVATDANVTKWLNRYHRQMWDMIVNANHDGQYLTSTDDTALVSGTQAYSLPSDFRELLEVWLVSGSNLIPLYEAGVAEFGEDPALYLQSSTDARNLRYRLLNHEIWFYPIPSSTDTFRLWYTPTYTEFESGVFEALPAYYPDKAWDFMVNSAVALFRALEESDPSFFAAEAQQLKREMMYELQRVNAGQPRRVERVYGRGR